MAMNNYTLGRGELFFARFKASTQTPLAERYLGNSPELAFSAEQETLDHFNSDRGIRKKDDSVILEIGYNGNFILDDIQKENLAMFFLGESSTLSDAGSSVTDERHQDDVAPGQYLQLGTSATNPAGVRQISAVTVNLDPGGTPTAATGGVDYTIDLELARIFIIEGGAIGEGVEIGVDYTIEASSRIQVISKADSVNGAMRFIAHNPKGENIDYFMPYVQLTPNGDFNLKGDDWQQLPFNLEILQKTGLESIYANGRPFTP